MKFAKAALLCAFVSGCAQDTPVDHTGPSLFDDDSSWRAPNHSHLATFSLQLPATLEDRVSSFSQVVYRDYGTGVFVYDTKSGSTKKILDNYQIHHMNFLPQSNLFAAQVKGKDGGDSIISDTEGNYVSFEHALKKQEAYNGAMPWIYAVVGNIPRTRRIFALSNGVAEVNFSTGVARKIAPQCLSSQPYQTLVHCVAASPDQKEIAWIEHAYGNIFALFSRKLEGSLVYDGQTEKLDVYEEAGHNSNIHLQWLDNERLIFYFTEHSAANTPAFHVYHIPTKTDTRIPVNKGTSKYGVYTSDKKQLYTSRYNELGYFAIDEVVAGKPEFHTVIPNMASLVELVPSEDNCVYAFCEDGERSFFMIVKDGKVMQEVPVLSKRIAEVIVSPGSTYISKNKQR